MLDQGFGNVAWRHLFPSTYIQVVESSYSNHLPLLSYRLKTLTYIIVKSDRIPVLTILFLLRFLVLKEVRSNGEGGRGGRAGRLSFFKPM